MSANITTLTDANFKTEVLDNNDPVLVDYWAEWCGPCKMIGPILDQVAQTGDIKIGKLNIDENPDTPPKYGIRGIPTLMIFKDGVVAATKVGAVNRSQLDTFINDYI